MTKKKPDIDLDNYTVPDLRPDAIRQLDEYIKAMNVMMMLRHQDKDDLTRSWYTQVVNEIDPVLLYIMLRTPEPHRLKARLETVDNTQMVMISPYMFDVLTEYVDTFKKNVEGAQNINPECLIGGKADD